MKWQAPGPELQHGRTRWWRNWPWFDLDNGRPVPKHDLAYEVFWKPKAFPAWTYELVRCLVNFKGIDKEIGPEDLRLLGNLPSFTELSFRQQRCLVFTFQKRPPVRLVRNRSGTHWPEKYTLPLPPLSFDGEVFSKDAILSFLGRHLEAQDKARGLIEARGRKGCRSRNRNQSYKLGNWMWVELAQHRKSSAPALTRAQQKVRGRAKAHALKYYRQILAGYFLGQTALLMPSSVPLIPGLIYEKVPATRLAGVLQKHSLAASKA